MDHATAATTHLWVGRVGPWYTTGYRADVRAE